MVPKNQLKYNQKLNCEVFSFLFELLVDKGENYLLNREVYYSLKGHLNISSFKVVLMQNDHHLLKKMRKPMKSIYEVFPIGLELLVDKGANFILNREVYYSWKGVFSISSFK